ncbi:MAG: hypothetical protein B6I24_07855 [Bacteroidetes bacterium 4572_128]|nr:MAG: hypothetical protein B6I24_07855 [Bacteroidetes bacterium 4572_128]
MRSVSVTFFLKKFQNKERLKDIKYWLPYSAGQLVKLDYNLDDDYNNKLDDSRRRIEIKLFRHEESLKR